MSGRKVKTARDFVLGSRQAGVSVIVGVLVGSMVGGASTIGTAQLSITHGYSAWWHSLGSGIGCAILGIFVSGPLRSSGCSTLPEILQSTYGNRVAFIVTILVSLGTIFGVTTQVISGVALLTAVSNIPAIGAAGIILLLMMAYVVFGGVWSTGYVGILKVILLYGFVVLTGVFAVIFQGGPGAFRASLPGKQYFNLFARGPGVDMGSFFSLLVGILSSQTYIQAMISAKNRKVSRYGAVIGALLIPPIGVAGIFVGMYMKLNYPEVVPAFAMPIFIMEKFPPVIAGMILAALMITLVGAGAGLSLGIGAMIGNDIYRIHINPHVGSGGLLAVNRFSIGLVLVISAVLSLTFTETIILDWSYLATSFRGVVSCLPLAAALFFPKKIPERFVLVSVLAGPVFLVIGRFLHISFDSVFLGMGVSCLIIIIGFISGVFYPKPPPPESINCRRKRP
jgi:SSS family solute:Na+ symporter